MHATTILSALFAVALAAPVLKQHEARGAAELLARSKPGTILDSAANVKSDELFERSESVEGLDSALRARPGELIERSESTLLGSAKARPVGANAEILPRARRIETEDLTERATSGETIKFVEKAKEVSPGGLIDRARMGTTVEMVPRSRRVHTGELLERSKEAVDLRGRVAKKNVKFSG